MEAQFLNLIFMFQKLKQKMALWCNGGRNHSKNAADPKSLISRINFNLKSLFVTLMFICFCSATAYAQGKNSNDRLTPILTITLIGGVAFVVAFVTSQKANKNLKEYQPVFNEIFKKQGFSATDIICTNCSQIIHKNTYEYMVHNIVIGVKDNVISFFGGGSRRVNFKIGDKKVLFFEKSTTHEDMLNKALRQPEDIVLYDGITAGVLFSGVNERNFRHLFDIPIDNLEGIEGMSRDKRIELFIEHSGELLTIAPYCKYNQPATDTANIIVDVFDKIMNDTLSSIKIYKTNIAIHTAHKQDIDIATKAFWGKVGAVVGAAVAIGGAATISGARNHRRDR